MGKLFNLMVLGLQGNPLNKEIMSLYSEPNGTQKLLTYMLDNLQGRNLLTFFLRNDQAFLSICKWILLLYEREAAHKVLVASIQYSIHKPKRKPYSQKSRCLVYLDWKVIKYLKNLNILSDILTCSINQFDCSYTFLFDEIFNIKNLKLV